MVFYFTGTGNSLYVAKQVEENPISTPQVMGKSRLDFTAERIGIVTPIYGHEMPEMVKDISQYDVIFIGYPIWWNEAPAMISTFPAENDFSGKVVAPFCTSASAASTTVCTSSVSWRRMLYWQTD